MDRKDAGVKSAAKYAISIDYPSGTTTYKIVDAKYASCADTLFSGGLVQLKIRYYLDVAITSIATKTCVLRNYVVMKPDDPKDTPQYGIYSNMVLSRKCPKK